MDWDKGLIFRLFKCWKLNRNDLKIIIKSVFTEDFTKYLTNQTGFGYSIDLSSDGKILAIGSPEIDIENKNGRTSIYQLVDNNWIKLGNDIVGEENTDEAPEIPENNK